MQNNNGDSKSKIQDELMAFFENVLGPYLDREFGALKEGVVVLKGDVATLKEDVTVLKEDVGTLKTDMMYVKNDIRDLKADMPSKKDYEAVKALA